MIDIRHSFYEHGDVHVMVSDTSQYKRERERDRETEGERFATKN